MKIWREGEKDDNFAHTKLTPRRKTRGGRVEAYHPSPCPPPQNGCKLSFHFTVKIPSSPV